MLDHPRHIQRFEVLEPLGAGGMGVVYRARDPELERDVAVKVLVAAADIDELKTDATVDLRHSGAAVNRGLLHEARVMAQLSHPNVLPIYEVGIADDKVFLVMEHIDGLDAQAWLREPRTTAQVLEVFMQAGRGLVAAHARGIVHRDFKPANVLIGRDGRVRVADFGLSHLMAPSEATTGSDLRGTPRFMAPELWDGAPATMRSDVYAWCSALDHALGGQPAEPAAASDRRWRTRGLSARQRQSLAAGLSTAPATRPPLTEVLDAFTRRRSAARWIAASAAVAVAGGVAAAAVVTSGDEPARSEVACELEDPRFAARYDELRRAIEAQPGAAAALPVLDAKRQQIGSQRREICAGLRAGTLGAVQQRERASCVDRVWFLLEPMMERLAAAQYGRAAPHDLAAWVPEPDECTAIAAPPLPEDSRPVLALHRRYVASISPATAGLKAEVEYEAVETEADRLGERVLAAQAGLSLGVRLKNMDKLAAADEALQRAYRRALETRATSVSARALIERSSVAAQRGDAAIAKSLADLARDLAEQPTTPSRIRVLAYNELGRAELARGKYKEAAATLRNGLELARRLNVGVNDQRDLRFALTQILVVHEKDTAAAIELALETLELVKSTPRGERDPNTGVALALVAHAYRDKDMTTALDYSRRSTELLAASMPPGSRMLVSQRADHATLLKRAEQYEAAHAEYRAVLALTEPNQALRKLRPRLLADIAKTGFEIGRHADAVQTGEQALEELTSQSGRTHPDTLEIRTWLVETQLELGKLDEAARHVEALEQIYRADPDADARRELVLLEGTQKAYLTLLRGRPAPAEKLARRALSSWDELKGGGQERSMLHWVLGETLLAQRRAAPARAAFEEALRLARATQMHADALALAELGIARADALQGRPTARPAAAAVRAVLEKYPGRIRARQQADALLRPLARPRGRPAR